MAGPPKVEEQKYFEKLNIAVLSVDKIKSLIKSTITNTIKCWEKGQKVKKPCFHIIGPAGIGKTDICGQLSEELTKETGKEWANITVKAPVITRDDFIIPFPVKMHTPSGQEDVLKFRMLYSDFVPTDPNSYGLFIIDECGRGDHPLQQLMWQIQNEGKIHTRAFPKHWFVIAVDNPDDQEYSMDIIQDAAGIRRMLHIYTDLSVPAWLNHAIAMKFHPLVVEFIQVHPEFLYDFKSQKKGSVYANPASWERTSDVLWGYEPNNVLSSLSDIDSLTSGWVNTNMSRMFIDFCRNKLTENRKEILPADIVFKYNEIRNDVMKFVKEGNNAKLGSIMQSFIMYLLSSRPEIKEKERKNIIQFMVDLPIDTAAIFVTSIDGKERGSEEFIYASRLHTEMSKDKKYREEFYERMVAVGKKASSVVQR